MANPAIIRMLGHNSFEDLSRLNLGETGFHPEHPWHLFKQVLEKDGAIHNLEIKWMRTDGQEIIVEKNARAIRGPNGVTLFYESFVVDVTSRKRAERARSDRQDLLRIFIKDSPSAISMLDSQLRFIAVSKGWLSKYGLKIRDVRGHNI